MGLDDLIPEHENSGTRSLKKYGSHPADEKLENWVEEFRERFPTEVDIDFIEVSPELEKTLARTYFRKRDGEMVRYIRISEQVLEMAPWYQRQVLLHTITQLWMNQMGAKEIDAGHAIKKWVCGQVGCMINAVDVDSDEWQLLAEPFLDEDMKR